MTAPADEHPSVDEDARRRFEAAWESGRPEPLERFLPPANHPSFLPTLEELVHIDLEYAWRAAGGVGDLASTASARVPTPVEDYVRRFPELNNTEVLRRLAQQEYRVREHGGKPLSPEAFAARFPGLTLPNPPT